MAREQQPPERSWPAGKERLAQLQRDYSRQQPVIETRKQRKRRVQRAERAAEQAQGRVKRDERHRYRHVRSVLVFGLFAWCDLGLFIWALRAERLEPLLVRAVLAILAAYVAQPVSRREPWAARQALAAAMMVLIPTGGLMALYWSWRRTIPSGSWSDVPTVPDLYRSPLHWEGVLDVVPLIDVLDSEDATYKKSVLLQVQTMRSPVEISVVRKALDDPEPEVRYYAASLLSHEEAAHMERIRRLEQQTDLHPQAPQAWHDLALEYGELIRAGIAGQELSRFFQEKRLAALDRSLALDPHAAHVAVERAESLLALGQLASAEQAATAVVDATSGAVADRARGVLMGLAWMRDDQQQLLALARQVKHLAALPDEVRGLAALVLQDAQQEVEA